MSVSLSGSRSSSYSSPTWSRSYSPSSSINVDVRGEAIEEREDNVLVGGECENCELRIKGSAGGSFTIARGAVSFTRGFVVADVPFITDLLPVERADKDDRDAVLGLCPNPNADPGAERRALTRTEPLVRRAVVVGVVEPFETGGSSDPNLKVCNLGDVGGDVAGRADCRAGGEYV